MRLVYVTLAWCSGIVVATMPPFQRLDVWIVLAAAATAALCWLWFLPRARFPAFLVIVLTCGGLRMALTPNSAPITIYNETTGAIVTGIIDSEPLQRDDGSLQFLLDAETVSTGLDAVPTDGRVLVRAQPPPSPTRLNYGDRVSVHGTPSTPRRIDDFDYSAFLARSAVYTVWRSATVTVIEPSHGSPVIAALLRLKAELRTQVESALPAPHSALLQGILFGDDALPDTVRADFAAAGTAHIIAVSGFNLAIVAGTVRAALKGTGRSSRQAAIGALLVMTAYAVMVGLTGGVFRAWVMTGVVIAGELFRRRAYAPASLALAIVVLTLIEPRDLADVSFQMSAAAALGLALLARPITHYLQTGLRLILPQPIYRAVAGSAAEMIGTSLAAFAFVAPLIALYFGTLSLVTLPVNVLIAPVQPLLLIIGGAAVMMGLILPVAGQIALLLLYPALSWTISITRGFANLANAEISVPVDPTLVTVVFAAIIGAAIMDAARPRWFVRLTAAMSSRTLLLGAALAAISVFALAGSIAAARPDGHLHLWALDMDGRNAILIQSPGGAHILVDGGSSPRRLLSALGDRLPVNKRFLDLVVISSPTEWHIRALEDVLARYPAHSALITDAPSSDEHLIAVLSQLPTGRSVAVSAGYTVTFSDGLRIDILAPMWTALDALHPADRGMVLRLTYGDVSVLLTGDLSRSGQSALLESGHDLRATILQIPDQGMGVVAAFLAAVQPTLALIEPLPDTSTIDTEALAILGDIPILSTGGGSAVHLWTNGQSLWYAAP